jgi:uncharacterized protein YkwD
LVRTLVVCLLAAGVLALPPSASGSAADTAVDSINHARAKRGLRALRVSPSLKRSSRRYASWMLKHDYFGHQSRITASGSFRRLGETLAMRYGGSVSARWAVRAWMRSAAHRRILMSSRFTWIGVGAVRGRMGSRRAVTWVAHVGKR